MEVMAKAMAVEDTTTMDLDTIKPTSMGLTTTTTVTGMAMATADTITILLSTDIPLVVGATLLDMDMVAMAMLAVVQITSAISSSKSEEAVTQLAIDCLLLLVGYHLAWTHME